MRTLREIRNFAGRDEYAAVIAAYERCRGQEATIGDPYWDRRALWIGHLPDSEMLARRILTRWRRRATALASLQAGRRLYPDAILVVRWDGEAMPPHRDHCLGDGTPNQTPWREWSGVVYLNEGYSGGQLIFPESDEVYHPVAGALVLFSAADLHGVAAADGPPRYTAPMWFTSDRRHACELNALA
jgi:hypothetical protein